MHTISLFRLSTSTDPVGQQIWQLHCQNDGCFLAYYSVYSIAEQCSSALFGGILLRGQHNQCVLCIPPKYCPQEQGLTFYVVGFSLAVGIVLLLAILARYVSTRAEVSWHVRYADRSTLNGTIGHNMSLTSFDSATGAPLHMKSIYDNWLVVRFTIAFAGLA